MFVGTIISISLSIFNYDDSCNLTSTNALWPYAYALCLMPNALCLQGS